MPSSHPSGLSPHTPPLHPAAAAPQPGCAVAGRPAPLPVSARALRAARSVRYAAADMSQRLNRSMRVAAENAGKVSAATWCWIKFKTQWQFWAVLILLMTGWYLFAQHPAAVSLAEAHAAYDAKYKESAQIQAEVNQLRQAYEPLRRGDPYAWELLARRQLGWKQKREVVTIERKAPTDQLGPAVQTSPGKN